MPCYKPVKAWYGEKLASGKRAIVFSSGQAQSCLSLALPCGTCVGCRLERARQWAMRCMHENRLSKVSCFVTLTYSNDYLPLGGTLVKRDLQLFMKRLRKLKGAGIRFYACGEYGEFNCRPHYHALLFNCEFDDKLRIGQNGRGEVYYHSKELRSVWPFGHNVIGDVTFDSAAYVARYVMKKINGARAAEHYAVVDGDGSVFDRLPEFTVMSRRPGIGTGWYEKYGAETYTHDSVVVNGREVRPPRFYDLKFADTNEQVFGNLKLKRRRKAWLLRADNTKVRLRVKEFIQLRKLKQLERSL